jgi:hypothetical protein
MDSRVRREDEEGALQAIFIVMIGPVRNDGSGVIGAKLYC